MGINNLLESLSIFYQENNLIHNNRMVYTKKAPLKRCFFCVLNLYVTAYKMAKLNRCTLYIPCKQPTQIQEMQKKPIFHQPILQQSLIEVEIIHLSSGSLEIQVVQQKFLALCRYFSYLSLRHWPFSY